MLGIFAEQTKILRKERASVLWMKEKKLFLYLHVLCGDLVEAMG